MGLTPFERLLKHQGINYIIERTRETVIDLPNSKNGRYFICFAPDTNIIVGDCLTCRSSQYHVKDMMVTYWMAERHYLEVYV